MSEGIALRVESNRRHKAICEKNNIPFCLSDSELGEIDLFDELIHVKALVWHADAMIQMHINDLSALAKWKDLTKDFEATNGK